MSLVEAQIEKRVASVRHEYEKENVEVALKRWTEQVILRFFDLTLDFSQIMHHYKDQLHDVPAIEREKTEVLLMLRDVSASIVRHQFAKSKLNELFDFIRETTFNKEKSLIKGLPCYVFDLKRIQKEMSKSDVFAYHNSYKESRDANLS